MAEAAPTTSRRAILGAMLAAPLVAVPVGANPSSLDARIARYAVMPEWPDECDDDMAELLDAVEALPNSPANAGTRARAVLMLHQEGVHTFHEDSDANDTRLVRQIVAALRSH